MIGRTYPEPLEAINFDMTLLDQADAACEELSPLLAVARGEGLEDNEAKLNRDRAYTYLKASVDEIRAFGQYLFWRNPVRARGYASEYLRSRRRGKSSVSDTDSQAATAESAG